MFTALPLSLAFSGAALAEPEALSDDNKAQSSAMPVSLGPRPFFLVDDMDEDNTQSAKLKSRLEQCAADLTVYERSDFSIGHRGAPMMFPEHTRESWLAAARMGAGALECDVAFTEDKELVCRHSQSDLHSTTNILETPLAEQCSVPPEYSTDGKLTNAEDILCSTSDITLAEFKTLEGRMDGVNTEADTLEAYMAGNPRWRTELYSSRGTLMTHAESIELFKSLGVKMVPELKTPTVEMPFDGMTQQDYAQKLIDEYVAAGVDPSDVFPQSFLLDDVRYWVDNTEFGEQAVFLDDRDTQPDFDVSNPDSWKPSMQELADMGVKILAPPMWMLLAESDDADHPIVPSVYAEQANEAGLDLIAWSFERSAPLTEDGAWYHQTTDNVINNDGDKMVSLDVLARDVGVRAVFSDWPASVTFYANCMAEEL
ncbi:glycerophosphodiester phosphodiesterase [Halomonas huangheensis]|nr:glycerophosphodiester phosphodiesterase [Halomonas huangheensis]